LKPFHRKYPKGIGGIPHVKDRQFDKSRNIGLIFKSGSSQAYNIIGKIELSPAVDPFIEIIRREQTNLSSWSLLSTLKILTYSSL
jgi:hypothetical protein